MARTFAGSAYVTTALGQAASLNSAITVATICKTTVDAAVFRFQFQMSNSLTVGYGLLLNNSNQICFRTDSTSSSSGMTHVVADGWVLIVSTKAAGSAAPITYKYVYSTSVWSSATHGSAVADATAGSTSCSIGASGATSAGWYGDILVAGAWDRVLSEAESKLLILSVSNWVKTSPKILWLLDQGRTSESVPDIAGGGSNQTALTGTTISATDPPFLGRLRLNNYAFIKVGDGMSVSGGIR